MLPLRDRVQPRYPVPARCRPCPPQRLSGRMFAQALDHVPAAEVQLVGGSTFSTIGLWWPAGAAVHSPPKPLGRLLYGIFLNLAIPSALPGSVRLKNTKTQKHKIASQLLPLRVVAATRRSEAFHNFTCQGENRRHPNKAPLLPGSQFLSVCSPFAILTKYFKSPNPTDLARPN